MSYLDTDQEQFRKHLHTAADMIADLYQNAGALKVFHGRRPLEIREMFREPLPEYPRPMSDIMDIVKNDVFPNVAIHFSPNFYAWVTSCASPAALVGELLATGINVNATTWLNAASASEIENQTIQWIGEFIGYDKHAGGVFVSGGSAANLTGITMARKFKSVSNIVDEGLRSQQQLTVYTSDQNHFCIDKSIDSLGIGKNYLRKIPTTTDYRINTELLESRIIQDKADGLLPVCVVGNAGTVNTGAIDPLNDLATICEKHDLWFHVDAAYGGCAAATDLAKPLFSGLEKADSIAVDLHKWLFVPFEAGCVLVKDKERLRETFSFIPEYQKFNHHEDIRTDYPEYSLQQSRNFKALKVWMAFKVYGSELLKKAIQGNIMVMNYLAGLINRTNDFELIAHGLSIVCFRYIGSNKQDEKYLNDLNSRIVAETEKDCRIFIRETKVGGKIVLRACCTNHRRDIHHVEHLLEVIREIGQNNA